MDGLGKANSYRYSQFQDIFMKEKLTKTNEQKWEQMWELKGGLNS